MFEYRTISIDESVYDLEQQLNQAAADGWRLKDVVQGPDPLAIMERERPKPTAEPATAASETPMETLRPLFRYTS